MTLLKKILTVAAIGGMALVSANLSASAGIFHHHHHHWHHHHHGY